MVSANDDDIDSSNSKDILRNEDIAARATMYLGLEIDPRSIASAKKSHRLSSLSPTLSVCDPVMPPKSLFRQPGAQHFQVVHRSQRDPLIHDPDASKHVLKPVVRGNLAKVTCACRSLDNYIVLNA